MAGRVFDFKIEGMDEAVKLRSMNWKAAKQFVSEGRELLNNQDAPDDAWIQRRDSLVQKSFEDAGGEGDVAELFDGEQLNQMQVKIMEWSGLKTQGEAKATSISTGSKAA